MFKQKKIGVFSVYNNKRIPKRIEKMGCWKQNWTAKSTTGKLLQTKLKIQNRYEYM